MSQHTLFTLAHLRRAVDEGAAMMARWERERALGLEPPVVRRVEPIKYVAFRQGQAPARTAPAPAKVQCPRGATPANPPPAPAPRRRTSLGVYMDAEGKVRSLPNTAVGAAWGSVGYAAGKAMGTNPEVRLANNALQVVRSPLQYRDRPIAMGNVQVYGDGWDPECNYTSKYTRQWVNTGRHEEAHSYQAQRLGKLYGPLVGIGGLLFGDANPYETAADDYAAGKTTKPFSNRFR